MESTTIRIYFNTKDDLDNLKIVKRETYDEIIKRLIEFFKTKKEE